MAVKLRTSMNNGDSVTITPGQGDPFTLKAGSGGTVEVTADQLEVALTSVPGAEPANADARDAVAAATTDTAAVSPSS